MPTLRLAKGSGSGKPVKDEPLRDEPDGLVTRVDCRRVASNPPSETAALDWVAHEAPLEIHVQGHPWTMLMRTPGDDIDLAAGHVISERIARASDIESVRHSSIGAQADNVVLVTLRSGIEVDLRRHARRNFSSSSCGVCGKTPGKHTLSLAPPLTHGATFPLRAISTALDRLVDEQKGFSLCGGLHAVALADAEGGLVVVREDIGRHNALDKVVGWAHFQKATLRDRAVVLSGRCSFEMVQKAVSARFETIVAIGAVSSLAIVAATESDLNLVGFARDGRMTVYAGRVQ